MPIKKNTKVSKKRKQSVRFEQFSRDILAGLYEKKKIGAKVTHNVSLPSKAIKEDGEPLMRQVDVFVEFEDKSQSPFVVQCKNWTSAIPLPIVDSLIGMVSTLEQQCRGMIVVPNRFQKGAVVLAKQVGLELCILRPIKATDFADRIIPKIDAWAVMRGLSSDQVQIEIPIAFSKIYAKQMKRLSKVEPVEVRTYDSNGDQIGTMKDLHDAIHKSFNSEKDYDEYLTCEPIQKTFLKINNDLGEILKIRGRFRGKCLEKKRLKNSISHIFGSSRSEDVYLIDEKRNVIKPGEEFSADTGWFDLKKHFPHWFEDDNVAV